MRTIFQRSLCTKVGLEAAFHWLLCSSLPSTKYSVPRLKRERSRIERARSNVPVYDTVLGPQDVEPGYCGVVLLTAIRTALGLRAEHTAVPRAALSCLPVSQAILPEQSPDPVAEQARRPVVMLLPFPSSLLSLPFPSPRHLHPDPDMPGPSTLPSLCQTPLCSPPPPGPGLLQ